MKCRGCERGMIFHGVALINGDDVQNYCLSCVGEVLSDIVLHNASILFSHRGEHLSKDRSLLVIEVTNPMKKGIDGWHA